MTLFYRPCVIACITKTTPDAVSAPAREGALILVGKRPHQPPGRGWQLPQGGIEAGEQAKVAVFREVKEETGILRLEVVRELAEPIPYDFPPGSPSEKAQTFRGQAQIWFHLQTDQEPTRTSDEGEFEEYDWLPAEQIVKLIVDFKRQAYIAGLTKLGFL